TGLIIRHLGERFQRSNDTISRYVRKMIIIFSSNPFYSKYVHLPKPGDSAPSQLHDNPKYWPYFKDALGAIDGSHIHCAPPSSKRSLFRNRK
ncbi:hypothetical protein BD779DRAFT_1417150, partial [Infundibulicybe gibba]